MQKETRGIYLGSLDGPLKRRLLADYTVYRYMPAALGNTASGAGWLVFGRDSALLAQPFDTSRFEFTGEPFLLSDRVGSDPFYPANYTFSVSDNGVLVFDPSINHRHCQYLWVDRRGQQIDPLDTPVGNWTHKRARDDEATSVLLPARACYVAIIKSASPGALAIEKFRVLPSASVSGGSTRVQERA